MDVEVEVEVEVEVRRVEKQRFSCYYLQAS
jgi:hypothetical protein